MDTLIPHIITENKQPSYFKYLKIENVNEFFRGQVLVFLL